MTGTKVWVLVYTHRFGTDMFAFKESEEDRVVLQKVRVVLDQLERGEVSNPKVVDEILSLIRDGQWDEAVTVYLEKGRMEESFDYGICQIYATLDSLGPEISFLKKKALELRKS